VYGLRLPRPKGNWPIITNKGSGPMVGCKDIVGCKGDWPIFGFDADDTAHNPFEHKISQDNVCRLTILWQVAGPSVKTIPLAIEGILYTTNYEGFLTATRADTGAQVWSVQLGAEGQDYSVPLVLGDFIYVGFNDGTIWKVQRFDGSTVWTVQPDTTAGASISGSLNYAEVDGKIRILGGTDSGQDTGPAPYTFRGRVFALDAEDGSIIWSFSTVPNPQGAGAGVDRSSGVVDKKRGLYYVGTGHAFNEFAGEFSASLLAIDYRTGKLRWSYQFAKDSIFSTEFPNGNQVDVSGNPNLFTVKACDENGVEDANGAQRDLVGVSTTGGIYGAFDRSTGKVAWLKNLIPNGFVAGRGVTNASGTFVDGVIYVAGTYDPEQLLTSPILIAASADDIPSIQIALTALTTEMRNQVIALDAATGKTIWTEVFAGAAASAAVTSANKIVYIGNYNGLFLALRAEDGEVLRAIESPTVTVFDVTFRLPFNSGTSIAHGKAFTSFGLEFIPGALNGYTVPCLTSGCPCHKSCDTGCLTA
jgi:polyvinyl alcohol dehydrogenase (cytochrome)